MSNQHYFYKTKTRDVETEYGSVSHPLAVQVVHSFGDGVQHSTGLSLREELLPKDFIQQLATFHELRH